MALATYSLPTLLSMSGTQMATGPSYIGGPNVQWDPVGDSTNNDAWRMLIPSKFNSDEAAGTSHAISNETTPIRMENNNGAVPSSSAQSNDLQVAVIPEYALNESAWISPSSAQPNTNNDKRDKNQWSGAATAAAATTLAAAAYKTQQKEENQKEEKEKDEEEEKKQKEEEQKSKNPRFKATSTNKKLTKSVSNLVKVKIPQLLMFSGAATLSAIAMNQRYNFVQDRKQAVKNASKRRKERSKDIW